MFLLYMRLLPFIPYELQNYIAGLIDISVGKFILASFIGLLPGTFALIYLGNTITDISQFKKELNKINKQGYAFDDEEWFNGMVGVSLPITNYKNELCFCLSTHTAKSRKKETI